VPFEQDLKEFYESELASGRKTFFPKEPQSNRNEFRTPNFIGNNNDSDVNKSRDSIISNIRTAFSGSALDDGERFTDAEMGNIVGNISKPVTARFFVVHDRDADNKRFRPSSVSRNTSGVHLWMDHLNTFHMNRDYNEEGHSTCLQWALLSNVDPRFTNDALWPNGTFAIRNRMFQGTLVDASQFIHVEMTATTNGDRIQSNTSKPQGYTRKQILALALAYICASLRRGIFLTVTAHREMDRGLNCIRDEKFRWGHGDPENFDICEFYRAINLVLFGFGFGADKAAGYAESFTYGIDADRMNEDKAGNGNESLNTFPNQYGPVRRKPQNWNDPNMIVIRRDGRKYRIAEPVIPTTGKGHLRRSDVYVTRGGDPFLEEIK
jgi:hypothetical protein